MKKIITLIMWLVLGSLSLNAQGSVKPGVSVAPKENSQLTTLVIEISNTATWDANNMFGIPGTTGMNDVIKNGSASTGIYSIRNYEYDIVHAEELIQEDVAKNTLEGTPHPQGPCRCKLPGYGCHSASCTLSCNNICHPVIPVAGIN